MKELPKHEPNLTKAEARGVLWWLVAGLESYRFGSRYKPLIKGIKKIENKAEQLIYLKRDGGIGVKGKRGNDYIEQLIIESKSNPVPVRLKKIAAIWEKHWAIEDKKSVDAKPKEAVKG